MTLGIDIKAIGIAQVLRSLTRIMNECVREY